MEKKFDVKKLKSGPPALVEKFNVLADAVLYLLGRPQTKIKGGRNISVTHGNDGSIVIDSRGENVEETKHPFKIITKSSKDLEVWIWLGTVNGIVPLLTGLELSSDLDTAPFLTIGSSGGWIYIQADADSNYNVTSASLHSASSIDDIPEDTDSTIYIPIGQVYVVESKIKSVGNSINYSLSVNYCNGYWTGGIGY